MPKGFTLAETLITIGIIGIVVAITIPSIIHKHQSKVLETRFKKAYATLTNIHLQMVKDYDGVYANFIIADLYGLSNGPLNKQEALKTEYINTFAKYLKDAKDCSFTNAYINCSGNNNNKKYRTYRTYDGSTTMWEINDIVFNRALVAQDSTLFFFGSPAYRNARIFIDTNGSSKGPNRLGFDLFAFDIDKSDKIVKTRNTGNTTGGTTDGSSTATNICTSKKQGNQYNGFGCGEYALLNQNPDKPNLPYWSTLPW